MPNFEKFIDPKTDRFPNIPFIFRSSPVAKNMHRIVHRTSTGQKRRNSGLFRMHSELFRSHSERIPAIPFVFRTCTGGAPNGNRGWDGYKKERTRPWISSWTGIYSLHHRYIYGICSFNMRYYIVVMRYIIGFSDIKVGASVFRSALQWCGFGMNSEYIWLSIGIGGLFRTLPYLFRIATNGNEWVQCVFRAFRAYSVCIPDTVRIDVAATIRRNY